MKNQKFFDLTIPDLETTESYTSHFGLLTWKNTLNKGWTIKLKSSFIAEVEVSATSKEKAFQALENEVRKMFARSMCDLRDITKSLAYGQAIVFLGQQIPCIYHDFGYSSYRGNKICLDYYPNISSNQVALNFHYIGSKISLKIVGPTLNYCLTQLETELTSLRDGLWPKVTIIE